MDSFKNTVLKKAGYQGKHHNLRLKIYSHRHNNLGISKLCISRSGSSSDSTGPKNCEPPTTCYTICVSQNLTIKGQ